jgi:hypothetical protein
MSSVVRKVSGGMVVGRATVAALALLLAVVVAPARAAGPPIVSETLPVWVDRTSATLRAKVTPNDLPTNYRFELGTDAGYGTQIPADHELFTGSGTEPVTVTASPKGLQEETIYHFRVVATNSSGTTFGPDQRFDTLNSDGLASGRRYELVSSLDKGPVGEPVSPIAIYEMFFQVNPEGSNLLYQIGYGPPDATSSGGPLWEATRQPGGWRSSQFSPTALAPADEAFGEAPTAITWGVSRDLECSALASTQPLADAPPETAAAGLANLFRRNPDGTYTTITNLAPSNAGFLGPNGQTSGLYQLVGMSEDCGVVVFRSRAQYPGLPGAAAIRLYEWDHGVLRAINEVPAAAGMQAVASVPGATEGNPAATTDGQNFTRAVSEDGGSVYFSALRQKGDGPGGATEVNKPAVFARLDGTTTVDVSQSQTATASTFAKYQIASTDGSRVFFLANYGLTTTPTPGWPAACTHATGAGCDLYEYDFAKPAGSRLTSLSLDANPADTGGAGVVGVLDASEDGSHVYFAARGQLVPGQGSTQAENIADGAYSVYLAQAGSVVYVGRVLATDLTTAASGVLITRSSQSSQATWVSQATPDGRHLVFSSKANITGYQGGAVETYRYSADQEAIECVSCRRDGASSVTGINQNPLPREGRNIPSRLRLVSVDGKRVFFIKDDRLAPTAIEGQTNLYEWHEGQISFLATASAPSWEFVNLRVGGSDASGVDIYFQTRDRLNWEDRDERPDVYNARIGGGFDPPPSTPLPCDPLSEGSCQGPVSPTPQLAPPASAGVVGAGNATDRGAARCGRKQVRRAGRCVGKQAIAKRACAKRRGKAKKQCIRKKVGQLNRAASNNGRISK